MSERTWTAAAGDLWRSALQHKIISGIVLLCVAATLAGLSLAGASSSHQDPPAADPAAAGFSLPVLGHSGQRVSLAGYAGKPLIVNFFASWCAPCQQETPLLARFYRGERGKVALVGLDENDTSANAMAFTRAKGVTYPVGFDPEMTGANAYGVAALPQTFFLNARHDIVDRIFGAVTTASLSKGVALATAS